MTSTANHIYHVDGNWGTSQFKTPLDATVTHLHFIAHENPANEGSDGQSPTNHWTLYLSLNPSKSVQLDAAPGDIGRPGMIILESVPEHLPQDCIHRVSAIVTPGTTIKTILDVIINKKRDQYIFAPIGEGCRFWHSTFANDLSDAGVIMQSPAEEAKAALAMYWPYPAGTPPQPRLIAEGRFYDDTF